VEMPGKMFQKKALARAYLTRNRMSFGDAFLTAREASPGGKRSLISFQVQGKDFDPSRRIRVVLDAFQASWFKGDGVRIHALKVTPKEAVRDLLLARSRGKPVTRTLIEKVAPPSARLLPALGGRRNTGKRGKGRRP
jgi:hypothetical protein